eukprot:scaffold918_cov126-Cylindrotheca_fusiformis.AAC.13
MAPSSASTSTTITSRTLNTLTNNMGYLFPGKRQRPEKWEPTAKDLETANKSVFTSNAHFLLQGSSSPNKNSRSKDNRKYVVDENAINRQERHLWDVAENPSVVTTAVSKNTSTNPFVSPNPKKERSVHTPLLREEERRNSNHNSRNQGSSSSSSHRRMSSLLQISNDESSTIMTVDTPRNANEIEVMDLKSLSIDDFSMNFRENSEDCLTDVYEIEYKVHKSLCSGTLSIPLPQDVFHLVETQLSLLNEYLVRNKLKKTVAGDRLLVDCVLSILKNISKKQAQYRDRFLQDGLGACVAAANAFLFMVEKVEDFMGSVIDMFPYLRWSDTDPVTWMACQEALELASQFSADAVAAASNDAVLFVMGSMHDAGLSSMLFTHQWETELVNNDVSVSMTKLLERNISQVSKWMEQDFLFHKFVGSLVRATITFYIECFVQKADRLRSACSKTLSGRAKRRIAFRNPFQACVRLSDDIAILQEYFEEVATGNAFLTRVVSKEFSFMGLLVECMLQAAKHQQQHYHAVAMTNVSLEEFAFAIHKETGASVDITKYFMSDLWLLMGRKGQHVAVEEAISQLNDDLQLMSHDECVSPTFSCSSASGVSTDSFGFRLDEVFQTLYKDRRRSEKSMITIAEESIKKKRKEIAKELKNRELRLKYFLQDLEDEILIFGGRKSTLAEF